MIYGPLLRIAAPIVGAVFVFGAGYWTGYGHGKDKGAALALKTAELAAKEVVIREAQVEKCQAQVGKVNEATAEQAVKTVEMIKADQIARQQAERRAVAREKEYQKRQEAAFATLDELRRQIDAGAFQGCANERVGAELVGMLNSALGAGEGSDSP